MNSDAADFRYLGFLEILNLQPAEAKKISDCQPDGEDL
jgi:hypothetical protein